MSARMIIEIRMPLARRSAQQDVDSPNTLGDLALLCRNWRTQLAGKEHLDWFVRYISLGEVRDEDASRRSFFLGSEGDFKVEASIVSGFAESQAKSTTTSEEIGDSDRPHTDGLDPFLPS